MSNRFMISVAALALIAGTGLANAQGYNREGGGGAGSQQQQMQHSQSGGAAEHGGTTGKDSMGKEKGTVGQAGGSMKSGAEEKSSGAMKDEKSGAMNKDSTGKEKGTVGQSKSGAEEKSSGAMKDEKSSGTMHKNPTAEEKSGATKGQRTDERAQGQQDKSKGMSSESQSKAGTTTGESRQGQGGTNVQGQAGTSTQTTGQAGAGAKLSTEQRTQITSVIHEQRVAPVTNVNFSISVGTRIPRQGIELHALPPRVATIYPEWRTYKFILVREEIVIINPDTYEIVAVLNA
ncbi:MULTISPECIES: DUF1236 domain-containing protein [unclassified Bradyrhizobium]|uniref:DUF1236 domain-containing protein n=1 Tax=unclassified Bradyrhizobium TaxID=2631580 RepID=UPI002478D7F4|nr:MULTISPECIES: DUF1236 domain-containing protein [unclassified Bradyrhizobium]WGR68140.1 DUF1236 domain-containing protein [Bradyrhizobium sp. ISRA426]WGR80195.1 DUF1236 domain-containing protein [Bradyrhizobium sp. ISRA430]WGR83380.1 DUF1236 domain-containing protein [Bradyrhizobium sp. ISRA432]